MPLLTKFQNIWYHFKIGIKISSQLFFLPLWPTFFVNKLELVTKQINLILYEIIEMLLQYFVLCCHKNLPQKMSAVYIFRLCTVWQFHDLMSYQLSFDYAIYFYNEFNRWIQNKRLNMTLKLTKFCALVLSKTPKRIKEKMLKFEWKFWTENSATKKMQLVILWLT